MPSVSSFVRPFAAAIAAFLLSAALMGAMTSPRASAQDASRAEARAAFNAGVRQYAEGDYVAALESFQRAYELRPHPSVHANIANCFDRLGHRDLAVREFEAFFAESGANVSPEQRAEVESALARLRAEVPSPVVAEPRPPAPPVTPPTAQAPVVDAPASSPPSAALTEPEPEAPRETERGSSSLIWITGTATVVLGLGATITGVMALSADADFEIAVEDANDASLSTEDRELAVLDGHDAADRANALATATDLLLLGTLVAGTSTLILLLTGDEDVDSSEEASNIAWTPVLTPSSAGMILRGAL